MTDPCRGLFCRHLQSFDLHNFLSFAERTSRWGCPVCEKNVRFEDLRIDSLSQRALLHGAEYDSFMLNQDCTFAKVDKACSTPPTEKKNQPCGRDHSPLRALDLDQSDEADGNGSQVPLEFAALSEAGVWQYSEQAERVFTRGSASPAGSDADEDEAESSDALTDDSDVSEPEYLSPEEEARAKRCDPSGGAAGPIEGGSGSGPRPHSIRPRRSRAVVRYDESISDDDAAASLPVAAALQVAPDPDASATAGQSRSRPAATRGGAESTSSSAKAAASPAKRAAATAAKGTARRASGTAKPTPSPPAGLAVDPAPPGDLGAALVGRTLLYWWPEDGWQRGTVARVCPRAGPFSHVVAYNRRTSALRGTAESLLDAGSYGDRWVLLSPGGH